MFSDNLIEELTQPGKYASRTVLLYWDPVALDYVIATVPTGGGGGGTATAANQVLELAKAEAIRALLAGTLQVAGTFWQATQPVSLLAVPLPVGASTEATSAAILAKIVAAPALEAGNLATIAGKDFSTQATLAAVLAKLVAAPALEGGNLATIAGKDFATQATAAAILAKLTADPATQATLAAVLAQLAAGLNVNTGLLQATTAAQRLAQDPSTLTEQVAIANAILAQAKLTDTQPVHDLAMGSLTDLVLGASYGSTLDLLTKINKCVSQVAKDSTLQKLVAPLKAVPRYTTLLHR